MKYIRLLIILAVVTANIQTVSASYSDSLVSVVEKASADTVKLKALNELFLFWEFREPDRAEQYIVSALELARKLEEPVWLGMTYMNFGFLQEDKSDYRKALQSYLKANSYLNEKLSHKQFGKSFNALGIIYKHLGVYDSTFFYLNKALDVFERHGNAEGIASVHNNFGITYDAKGDYEKALDAYMKAIVIFDSLEMNYALAAAYGNMGTIYSSQKYLKKALIYHKKALEINRLTGNKLWEANNYNNISTCYSSLGFQDSAIYFILKARDIREYIGDKYGLSSCYSNLAGLYLEVDSNKKAIESLHKALNFISVTGEPTSLINTYIWYGKAYNKTNEPATGLEYLNKGLILADSVGAKAEIITVRNLMAESYMLLGDYRNAFEQLRLHSLLKDTLFRDNSTKHLNEVMTKYETEKKEQEIKLLNKDKKLKEAQLEKRNEEIKRQRILIFSFIGGFLIILIFSIILYRMFIQKKKANRLLEEQNIRISAQKEEIEAQRDEIVTQRDKLNTTLTELKETQGQLIESEKMASLGSLVTGVAHEINTPVGIGITASSSLAEETREFAKLYKEGNMSRKQLEGFLESAYSTSQLILKNMERTGQLVSKFKQVSVDQQSEQKRKFFIKEYITDLIHSLSPETNKWNADIQVIAEDDLEVESYPGVFAQIITNLISNSLIHGFEKDNTNKIVISIVKSADRLELLFTDNGKGIPSEILGHEFDPFVTSDKQKGVGLGLHIVYNLVTQKLMGKIECASIKGETQFLINMPVGY